MSSAEFSPETDSRARERRQQLNRSVARLELAFIVLSAVWLLAGDRLLAMLVSDPATLVRAQVWKDLAFLGVAAVTMGWMLRSELVRYAQSREAIVNAADLATENERRYRMIFDQSPLPMWIYAQDTRRVLAVNDAAITQYGYSRKEWMKLSINELRPKEELPRLERAMRHLHGPLPYGGETWIHVKKDGTRIDVDIASDELSFRGLRARLVIARDVTAQQATEERVYRLAYFDALTGLYNRAGMQEYLESAVANAPVVPFALILVDLDHFRDINDALGYAAGDQVLLEVKRRLRTVLPEPAPMGRISADVFAMTYDTDKPAEADALGHRLRQLFDEPITLEDGTVQVVTASTAVILAPAQGQTRDELMQRVEAVLHAAIAAGGNTSLAYQDVAR